MNGTRSIEFASRCHIYLRQIFRLGFAVSSQLTSDVGLICGFCSSPGGAWREDVRGTKPGVFVHLRDCLSPVCYLPKVALASYYLLLDLHFGIMPFNKETETKYRGLSPHKITLMSGVLHTESRVARLFEINIVRRDPVNIGVMPLNQ